MTKDKTSIIPTILISILLFTTSNLKIGKIIYSLLDALLYPFTSSTYKLQSLYQSQIETIKNLPNVNKTNREQKVFISHLISENEHLKQSLADSKIKNDFKNNYQEVLPIKISGRRNKIIATTSQSTENLKPGMPVVNGNILLGIVTNVDENLINIVSLEDDLFPAINLKSSTGPEGVYSHNNSTPKIINVPSQTPIILGDFVLTQPTELIPENLLVGKVSKVVTSPQDPLQKAELTLYDTFSNNPENIIVIIKP